MLRSAEHFLGRTYSVETYAGWGEMMKMYRKVMAALAAPKYGICSTEFLEQAFRTDSYRCDITFNNDGTWSYAIDTVLLVRGKPFNHHDTNTLNLIEAPALNPLAAILNDRSKQNPG